MLYYFEVYSHVHNPGVDGALARHHDALGVDIPAQPLPQLLENSNVVHSDTKLRNPVHNDTFFFAAHDVPPRRLLADARGRRTRRTEIAVVEPQTLTHAHAAQGRRHHAPSLLLQQTLLTIRQHAVLTEPVLRADIPYASCHR